MLSHSRRSLAEISDPMTARPEYAALLDRLVADIEAGAAVMRHESGCSCSMPDRFEATCVRLTAGPW